MLQNDEEQLINITHKAINALTFATSLYSQKPLVLDAAINRKLKNIKENIKSNEFNSKDLYWLTDELMQFFLDLELTIKTYKDFKLTFKISSGYKELLNFYNAYKKAIKEHKKALKKGFIVPNKVSFYNDDIKLSDKYILSLVEKNKEIMKIAEKKDSKNYDTNYWQYCFISIGDFSNVKETYSDMIEYMISENIFETIQRQEKKLKNVFIFNYYSIWKHIK